MKKHEKCVKLAVELIEDKVLIDMSQGSDTKGHIK